MVRLDPMTPDEFDAFAAHSLPLYADHKVEAGNWTAAEAPQRAIDEFAQLLPEGVRSAGHHLFTVRADDVGEAVGTVWLGSAPTGPPAGYVFDIVIHEPYRRRGYAAAALLALESEAARLGLREIKLHVFGNNPNAQALYAKLGYGVTNVNMSKRLVQD
ncbi:GNAT family N-acetyltransferase [soil metagenome]